MRLVVRSAIFVLTFVIVNGLCPHIVPRSQWSALPPKETFPMSTPVPIITIHHSATRNCTTNSDCEDIILSFQRTHMNDREWNDVAYSFLIGGDEPNVYEGRGWSSSVQGSHPEIFNNISYTICIIGTYEDNVPPVTHLELAKQLIECAVEEEYAVRHYNLTGHRDVFANTVCPGDAFYNEISTWENWHGKISGGNSQFPLKLNGVLKALILICLVLSFNKSITS